MEVGRLLDALGSAPRPAGGAAEGDARAHARGLLERAGFAVVDEAFAYSAFPGRWGTSLSGLAAMIVIGVAGHLASSGEPWLALAALVVGLALIGVAATYLARRGVLDAPLMRRSGVNLVASRGAVGHGPPASPPTLWLMAHLDSKSQPVPILVRSVAITVSAILFAMAAGLAIAQGWGLVGAQWWPALTVATWIALTPVAISVVSARSDGAIDNASGCAAVLLAAQALAPGRSIGIVLTSAEELGLAGARAFVRDRTPGICVNCDSVDDSGRWLAMHTGAPPAGLLAALHRASTRVGLEVRARRLLPGVLVDGVALADAGWQVVTISHGSVTTLSRIHTPRDSRRSLNGDAIGDAAALIATTVDEVG